MIARHRIARMTLEKDIAACTLCADRFAATATAHAPRPVVWFKRNARILVAGQAPGARVHQSGRPFTDPSGDRLRDWMGVDEAEFYDTARVAIVPMAFCFPGYDAKGSDLPPPKICAETWHDQVMTRLSNVRLRIVVGGAAHRYQCAIGAMSHRTSLSCLIRLGAIPDGSRRIRGLKQRCCPPSEPA